MRGRATLTTVESRNTMPDPSTAATRIQRRRSVIRPLLLRVRSAQIVGRAWPQRHDLNSAVASAPARERPPLIDAHPSERGGTSPAQGSRFGRADGDFLQPDL